MNWNFVPSKALSHLCTLNHNLKCFYEPIQPNNKPRVNVWVCGPASYCSCVRGAMRRQFLPLEVELPIKIFILILYKLGGNLFGQFIKVN